MIAMEILVNLAIPLFSSEFRSQYKSNQIFIFKFIRGESEGVCKIWQIVIYFIVVRCVQFERKDSL